MLELYTLMSLIAPFKTVLASGQLRRWCSIFLPSKLITKDFLSRRASLRFHSVQNGQAVQTHRLDRNDHLLERL